MKLFALALGVSVLSSGCGTSAPFSLKYRSDAGQQSMTCPAPQRLICSGGSASRIQSRVRDKFENCSCGSLGDIG